MDALWRGLGKAAPLSLPSRASAPCSTFRILLLCLTIVLFCETTTPNCASAKHAGLVICVKDVGLKPKIMLVASSARKHSAPRQARPGLPLPNLPRAQMRPPWVGAGVALALQLRLVLDCK